MPPLEIELSSRFRGPMRALPEARVEQVFQAVAQLSEASGKPHLHRGLGIRGLRGDSFEFRTGKDTRVVFKLEGSCAILLLTGNHDDVRRLLKGP